MHKAKSSMAYLALAGMSRGLKILSPFFLIPAFGLQDNLARGLSILLAVSCFTAGTLIGRKYKFPKNQ